jgi:hypothetical protein
LLPHHGAKFSLSPARPAILVALSMVGPRPIAPAGSESPTVGGWATYRQCAIIKQWHFETCCLDDDYDYDYDPLQLGHLREE